MPFVSKCGGIEGKELGIDESLGGDRSWSRDRSRDPQQEQQWPQAPGKCGGGGGDRAGVSGHGGSPGSRSARAPDGRESGFS